MRKRTFSGYIDFDDTALFPVMSVDDVPMGVSDDHINIPVTSSQNLHTTIKKREDKHQSNIKHFSFFYFE